MMQNLAWAERVHHDGSAVYVSNPLPRLGETVQVRLRTPADHTFQAVVMRAMLDGEFQAMFMEAKETCGTSQIWETDFKVEQPHIDYTFMLVDENSLYFYNQLGVREADTPDFNAFSLVADYSAPLWIRDAVFYQIFPDRFANGDLANDVQDDEYTLREFSTQKRKWGEPPYPWEKGGNLDFFGGDLQGITQKLDYLQDLGVTGIYLCPIFTSNTNHRYDMLDFFNVDEHVGGNEGLAELRAETAKRGMKLMLDITTNHCAVNHKWVQEAKADPASDAAHYFYRNPDTEDFERWLGVDLLVKLNYQSEKLQNIMYHSDHSVIRHWLRPPYSIDAWRIDVANMTGNFKAAQHDHEVWVGLREAAKDENPDAYLLGEFFQDYSAHLQGDELDASMNYQGFNIPMRRWLSDKIWIQGRELPVKNARLSTEALVQQWTAFMASVPYSIVLQQFNQLDSHDIARILYVTEGDKALAKLGFALMIGFPGTPCIYYGSEVGLAGGDDPFNRECMPWDEQDWDTDLRNYHKQLIAIRHASHALKHGGFQVLLTEKDCVAFVRESTEETMLVVGYRGTDDLSGVAIPVSDLGLTDGTILRDLVSDETITVKNGQLDLPTLTHGQAMLLTPQ